ncbi:MAG: KpsF/GutQ family sugar-phosphate isomerase [Nitrospinota bacterium]|nr:MAG: KpsF/GutQ family sugar-phosphate isomerase [Nitrospinota bacterium]
MNILQEIRRVLEAEISTLITVRDCVDDSYEKAVSLLYGCTGKVVVTGIGKSGIIAQKIAATMASTGTLALYLHPADGMHGNLGVVRENDVLLAISKSGESEELLGILPSLHQIGVRIITITANPASTLARHSDVVLQTPIEREACPLDLAPTSSTTAALAVGDALALTLMKLKDFKPEHFALYHPGGRLGKRLLLRVKDLMRSGENNPIIRVEESVSTMLCEITRKMTGAVSVVDKDGYLVGLVTDYDIRRALETGKDIFSLTIPQIMNPHPTTIYEDEKAVVALEIMENRERPFSLLPVLNHEERVVGMIHLHDIIGRGL